MNTTTMTILPDHLMNKVESIYVSATGYYHETIHHEIKRQAEEVSKESIIIYCVKGEGWLTTDHFTKTVLAGSFIFCDKGVAHAYGSNPDKPWSIYWAHFGGSFTDYMAQQLNLLGKVDVKTIKDLSKIIDNMECLLKELTKGEDDFHRLKSYTYLKMALLDTISLSQTNPSLSTDISKKAISFMNENIRSTLSLNDLATYCNLSKYHFTRLFKKHIGLTPIHYFNKLKIEHSKTLLLTSTMTISEISRTLSFNSPFYISEVFKHHSGLSPRDYREKTQSF